MVVAAGLTHKGRIKISDCQVCAARQTRLSHSVRWLSIRSGIMSKMLEVAQAQSLLIKILIIIIANCFALAHTKLSIKDKSQR